MDWPKIYYIERACSCCGMSLGLYICGGEHKHVIVMCDECESMWVNPDLGGEMYAPREPDWLCPHGDGTIASPDGHWANREEIEGTYWWDYVVNKDI